MFVVLVWLSLSAPAGALAQDDDALDDLDEPGPAAAAEPAEAADAPEPTSPGRLPATPAGDAPPAEPEQPPPPAVPLPPPAPPPSPFVFMLKGTAAATFFAQDTPFVTGNGGAALSGPLVVNADGWLLGGDVRSTRLTFIIRGPEALGAIPTGVAEFEMAGGNQVTTVPAASAPIVLRNAMGEPIGMGTVPVVTSSAQGDESLLPRMRTAYVELNWGLGNDILRVGQFHNLLLTMIASSATRPGTLGYPAGQVGWRTPGLTYIHRFKLGEETNLDAAVQLNRNSWIDNLPPCAAGGPPMVPNCLPSGVSLGESSMLPQVEARLLLSSGLAQQPSPYYAPTVWQVHLVGHWDQKDLSGVGAGAMPGFRDSMTTMVVEAGFKVKLGPVLLASNAWYGQNAGGVYGHVFQQQLPDKPDVTGFGVWGQLAFSFTENWALWGFAGIDHPDETKAIAAGFRSLQNVQLHTAITYTAGPIMLGLELFHAITTNYIPPMMLAPGAAPTLPQKIVAHGNQPSLTLAYSF